MTSNERWPQNMKSRISQKPLHWLDLNQIWNLSYWDQTRVEKGYQMKTTSNGRWPQGVSIEDNLQWKMTSNGRWPPTEDDLKIWKVEYLRNHWLDPTQIWNLSYRDQIKVQKDIKWGRTQIEDDLQRKMTSKYETENISATTDRILLKFKI